MQSIVLIFLADDAASRMYTEFPYTVSFQHRHHKSRTCCIHTMRVFTRLVGPLALTTISTFPLFSSITSVSGFVRHGASRHSTSFLRMTSSPVIPGRPTWQQTMLRIKDPAKTLPFYTDLLGFTLIDKYDFPQWNFSLYFLTTLPEGETYHLTPGTQEAHDYLWTMDGVALELTHNYGTETDPDFLGYHPGNKEKDGFGHIAVK